MINSTDLSGLAGVASGLTASLLLLPGISRLKKSSSAILLSVVFVLLLIPFGEISGTAYVRGMTGDLSITTLVLVWCALLRPWYDCFAARPQYHTLLAWVALTSLVLYPMALGASIHDPYRLGYGDPVFVVGLSLLAIIAWFSKSSLIVLCITLATLAWASGWYESTNLWDYLIDPFVALYALAVNLLFAIKKLGQ